jgi:hypothetical protein
MYKEPKWGHLRDLHQALRLCKKALLWGNPSSQPLGKLYEVLSNLTVNDHHCWRPCF